MAGCWNFTPQCDQHKNMEVPSNFPNASSVALLCSLTELSSTFAQMISETAILASQESHCLLNNAQAAESLALCRENRTKYTNAAFERSNRRQTLLALKFTPTVPIL
jgi:hypothetical protein